MAKWILWLGLIFGITGCQSEITHKDDSLEVLFPPESGTVVPPSRATVPLVFLLKEMEILNGKANLSVRDTALFRSLPPGVYAVQSDSIVFGIAPGVWISSGITRWPATERIALAELIILDNPLFSDKIGIFPQQPGSDGYVPGCFSCPQWMVQRYGALAVFWEKY